MVAVRVSPFGGMVPAVDDRLLPDVNAALSQDAWLYSGNVVGMPAPKVLRNLLTTTSKVYRIPNNFTDSLHLSDSVWMEFAHADTDVLRTQVVGDTFNRFYWVSPNTVPRYAPLATIQAQAPSVTGYLLGVPAPGNITATPSGGSSGTLKSVSYVQTFVTAYGEEGPPSVPVSLTGVKIDATVTVTLAAVDPNDLGTNRNITKKRIYRTIVATNGTATYFFVAEVTAATTSYADNAATATDAVIALNATLQSTNWQGPPSDLQGMVSLSNGMVVAFRSNELWFCEPFRMHAWPAQYVLTTEYPIIGLGVANQMLVVATQGFAYTATGINPSSISLVKLPGLLPCTSRGSIVSTTSGVFFSTPAGLVLISTAGVQVATKELIRKDEWGQLVATNTLRAAKLADAYYAFGQARFGVFDQASFDNSAFAQSDFSGARKGILIDPTSLSVAFNLLTSADPVTNVQTDAWSAEVFLIRNQQLLWMDIGDTAQTRGTFKWRSKIYQTPHRRNLQAMKVYFNESPAWPITYVQYPAIPTMTGPTTDGVTFSSASDVVGREAWRAASGVAGDAWYSALGVAVGIVVDLGVPTVISSYKFAGPPVAIGAGAAPKNWLMYAAPDGVGYVVIDTRTNQPAFGTGEERTYNIASGSQLAYRYYEFAATAVQSGTQPSIAGFQLYKPVLGIVRVYADGRLVMTRELKKSGEQWRMPSGFEAEFWQFEIESGVEILSLQAATSPTELRGV